MIVAEIVGDPGTASRSPDAADGLLPGASAGGERSVARAAGGDICGRNGERVGETTMGGTPMVTGLIVSRPTPLV